MPTITSIGHVGLHCRDLARQIDFYTRVLGFTVTDQNAQRGMYFMSTQPEIEHHMLLLCPGRQGDQPQLQQLSFHVESIAEVREYYRRLKAEGARITRVVTHGNAVSVYFLDPEDNLLEVYWTTPLLVHQPFGEPIDLEADDEGVMAQVRAIVEAKGRVWDPTEVVAVELPAAAPAGS